MKINLNWFRKQERKIVESISKEKQFDEIKLSTDKILNDMETLNPKFDLRDSKWRENPEEFTVQFFNPKNGHTTDDIRVPEKFKDWIIGQDEALNKLDLSTIEWLKTVQSIQAIEDKEAKGERLNSILRQRPTNNWLMIAKPGTGKSLIIKVAAENLKDIYKKLGIEMEDVVLYQDRLNRYEPNVRYLKPAGIGEKVVQFAEIEEGQKGKRKTALLFGGIGTIIALGITLVALGVRAMILNMIGGMDFEMALLRSAGIYFQIGISMITFPMFIMVIIYQIKGGIGAADHENLKIPNLIVNNNPKTTEMYENVTIVSDAALFGEIEWSPWQTGSMAKPPYRRVQSGAVHKAHKKILYIDEIRNLNESQATKLLTVMEDGECPVQAQGNTIAGGGAGGSTAGQNVRTPPIKSMFFFFAAGNMDIMTNPNSILNRFPALRDRFQNYGKIVHLRDEVEATPLSELLVAQVVRDEIYRFQFLPMEGAAVKLITDHVRLRASDKNHIKLMFRAVISVIKTSTQLAWRDGDSLVRVKHVKDALENYSASIERQVLEHELSKKLAITTVKNQGSRIGIINALTVITPSNIQDEDVKDETAGDVVALASQLRFVDQWEKAGFITTNVVSGDDKDIQDSKKRVRTAIIMLYGVDIEKECYVHVDFSQTRIDGPSAGVSMTVDLMSWLGEPEVFKKDYAEYKKSGKPMSQFPLKSIPLRQDGALTGALEIIEEPKGDVQVSAIGGIFEKIRGAKRYKLGFVMMPKANFDMKIMSNDQFGNIKLFAGDSVMSYFETFRADKIDTDESLTNQGLSERDLAKKKARSGQA